MSVAYYIRENPLTGRPGDFNAQVNSRNSSDLNAVIDRMVSMGSTVNRADILGVLQDFQNALLAMLQEGGSVTTPFANFRSSIQGVFKGPADSYDASRHRIMPDVRPGVALKRLYRTGMAASKREGSDKLPAPRDSIDHRTGERNSRVTPGSIFTLQGYRLAFDQNDPEQGIFFSGSDRHEIRVQVIGQISPSILIFEAPENLAPGKYTVMVRTRPGKKLLTGSLPFQLSVT
jgi:hypothetical protein